MSAASRKALLHKLIKAAAIDTFAGDQFSNLLYFFDILLKIVFAVQGGSRVIALLRLVRRVIDEQVLKVRQN